MLPNPYPPPDDENSAKERRFQTYLSGEDKSLLISIRPQRGTAQVVINNLIKNLCDELRQLNITTYHPDADTIFGILVEPRQLTIDQLNRLRRALAGTAAKIPARVQQPIRGSKVREGATDTKTGADHTKVKTSRGK